VYASFRKEVYTVSVKEMYGELRDVAVKYLDDY